MTSIETFAYNLVIAKVAHAAYLQYKYDPRTSDNFLVYKCASENYGNWYDTGSTKLGLSKDDMAGLVREGKRIFALVKRSNPKDIDAMLTPTNLRPLIAIDSIVQKLEGSVKRTTPMEEAFNKAVRASLGVTAATSEKAEVSTKLENKEHPMTPVQSTTTDIWVPVKGHEDFYECTAGGKIRSKVNPVKDSKGVSFQRGGIELSQLTRGNVVEVRINNAERKPCYYPLASLIANTFFEGVTDRCKVTMKDGNIYNVAVFNLIVGGAITAKTDKADSWAYARQVKKEKFLKQETKPSEVIENNITVVAPVEHKATSRVISNVTFPSTGRISSRTQDKSVEFIISVPEGYVQEMSSRAELIDMPTEEYVARAFTKFLKATWVKA